MKKVMGVFALLLVCFSFVYAEDFVRSRAETSFVVGDYSGSSFCEGWICALVVLIIILVGIILIVRKRRRVISRKKVLRKR